MFATALPYSYLSKIIFFLLSSSWAEFFATPLFTNFLFKPLIHLSMFFSLGLDGKLSWVTKVFKTSE